VKPRICFSRSEVISCALICMIGPVGVEGWAIAS
jgi:hypothetical protein